MSVTLEGPGKSNKTEIQPQHNLTHDLKAQYETTIEGYRKEVERVTALYH